MICMTCASRSRGRANGLWVRGASGSTRSAASATTDDDTPPASATASCSATDGGTLVTMAAAFGPLLAPPPEGLSVSARSESTVLTGSDSCCSVSSVPATAAASASTSQRVLGTVADAATIAPYAGKTASAVSPSTVMGEHASRAPAAARARPLSGGRAARPRDGGSRVLVGASHIPIDGMSVERVVSE